MAEKEERAMKAHKLKIEDEERIRRQTIEEEERIRRQTIEDEERATAKRLK